MKSPRGSYASVLESVSWIDLGSEKFEQICAFNQKANLRAGDAGDLFCFQQASIVVPDPTLICFDEEIVILPVLPCYAEA